MQIKNAMNNYLDLARQDSNGDPPHDDDPAQGGPQDENIVHVWNPRNDMEDADKRLEFNKTLSDFYNNDPTIAVGRPPEPGQGTTTRVYFLPHKEFNAVVIKGISCFIYRNLDNVYVLELMLIGNDNIIIEVPGLGYEDVKVFDSVNINFVVNEIKRIFEAIDN